MAEQAQKVGARIAQEREKRSWSRPELARRLEGVATGNDVYRWEKGKHLPRSDTMEAIAALFKIEVADLYAGPVDAASEGSNGDLMESLNGAQAKAQLPQQVADALGALTAELGEKLDKMNGEIEEIRQLVESSGRTRKSRGS